MKDDIVTRLREWASQFGTYEGEQKNADDLRSAANEIERLRRELAMARKWRNNFKLAFENSQKSCKYWYEKVKQYDEA